MMLTGMVRYFSDGEGWIVPDAGGLDVYVNWRRCVGAWAPRPGERVKYVTDSTVAGDATARWVEPLWWDISYPVAG
jgi:cold shock CspA family protein